MAPAYCTGNHYSNAMPLSVSGAARGPGRGFPTCGAHGTRAGVSRGVAVSALAVGFTPVVMVGDHSETQGVIREVATALDDEWRPKGGRVFFIPVYDEGEGRMREILAALGVPANQRTPIDDASEIMAIDTDGRWLRPNQLADEIAAVASAELGRQFIDGKVELAVARIRELVGR